MSTAFFLKISPCRHCGRPEELLLIGRSSGGWKFQLNAIKSKNLTSLDAWARLFSDEKHVIVDEYDVVNVTKLQDLVEGFDGDRRTERDFPTKTHLSNVLKHLGYHKSYALDPAEGE